MSTLSVSRLGTTYSIDVRPASNIEAKIREYMADPLRSAVLRTMPELTMLIELLLEEVAAERHRVASAQTTTSSQVAMYQQMAEQRKQIAQQVEQLQREADKRAFAEKVAKQDAQPSSLVKRLKDIF